VGIEGQVRLAIRRPRGNVARAYAATTVRLDQAWRSASYCAVDLETTGLDLRRDMIVSFGSVGIDGGRVIAGSSIYRLVGGRRHVSPDAIAVHALRPADLADAPPWEESVDLLLTALTGRVLVAHAAWVERAFLRRAFRTRRVPPPRTIVDTAALARSAGVAAVGASAEPSLELLARDLGLPVHEPHHALGDALTTAEVFLALSTRLDAVAPQTVGSLVSASRRFALR
jgi:DNA polymerase III subunit epsilon